MTLQRLDELRGLLEKHKVKCPCSCHLKVVFVADSHCPQCASTDRVPDPKWAPMLALFVPGPGRQRDAFWNVIPEGALAGAIREAAWHAGIPRPVLDAAFAEIFGAASPNQAAVDWCIAQLKDVPRESELPTIEEMSGLVEDFTAGMSLGDYMKEIRGD